MWISDLIYAEKKVNQSVNIVITRERECHSFHWQWWYEPRAVRLMIYHSLQVVALGAEADPSTLKNHFESESP